MHGRVVRQFGMKRRGHHAAFADQHRMPGILRENFNSLPDRFNDRRADENHLERLFAQLGLGHVDVARKLPAVAVAQDRDVEQPERRLRGPVDLARE